MGSPTHSPIENTYMAIKTSKTEGRFQTKVDDAHEVDMQLGKMEDDIRKLKIDFDIYFNGSSKRPPLEARARLDAFIKRLSDNRNLTFAQRYLFNTLVARFVSYRELWRRQLKAKGEDLL
jgi:hypothetical protein